MGERTVLKKQHLRFIYLLKSGLIVQIYYLYKYKYHKFLFWSTAQGTDLLKNPFLFNYFFIFIFLDFFGGNSISP